ncbi:hypothetical protein E3E51_06025 [Thermococcus sp. 21S7]|nr:hypothetical protein [Thermococcus sp. 21S7]
MTVKKCALTFKCLSIQEFGNYVVQQLCDHRKGESLSRAVP